MERKNTFTAIYEAVKRIPKGKVATYGQVAKLVGNPKLSRVVGYALHVNPDPNTIPCHRVVNRQGRTSSAFVFGGESMQRILLEGEGILFLADGTVDLDRYQWRENV